MTKNNLFTVLIIGLALAGVAGMWWDNNRQQEKVRSKVVSEAASKDLKQLEVAVPGMFCAGCTASVEGFLSGVPGIKYVEARLAPERSATIVYDPSQTTRDDILEQSIFDTYGPVSLISETDAEEGEVAGQQRRQAIIPDDVELLSTQVAGLLQEKVEAGISLSGLDQQLQEVSVSMENEDYDQARRQFTAILNQLKENNL